MRADPDGSIGDDVGVLDELVAWKACVYLLARGTPVQMPVAQARLVEPRETGPGERCCELFPAADAGTLCLEEPERQASSFTWAKDPDGNILAFESRRG
jgi:hypothetical protein